MKDCNLVMTCKCQAFIMIIFCLLFVGCEKRKISFPQQIETREDRTAGVLCGKFTIRTKKYLNKTSTVFFAIPFDFQAGCPLASASNILFYAPFNGEVGSIRRGLPEWLLQIASRDGCTVFTLTIVADTLSVEDHSKYYVFKESGWHDIVFQIKEFIEERWGLENRGLLLLGQSSGGSMIQQMTSFFPEKIASAAWHGGTRYSPFSKDIKYPRMLASNTWGCYGSEVTAEMTEESQKLGIDIEHVLVPPKWKGTFSQIDSHSATPCVFEMLTDFLFKRDWKRRMDFKIEVALQGEACIGPLQPEARGNIIFCTEKACDKKEMVDDWRLLLWGTSKLNLNGAILQLSAGEESQNIANLRHLVSQLTAVSVSKVWVVCADEGCFNDEVKKQFNFVFKCEDEWEEVVEMVAP